MASFKPTIITKKGHALMAKIVAGKATPKFTKISVSDHEYSSSTNFESVTNLSSIKQTTHVSSVSKINSAAVKVSGALSNAELSTGYYLRTIGLYASDPSEGEILYSITTATKPDWIPPNNGVSASSIMIDLITVVSNASNVSIDVDPNATATVAQINELKDEMDKNKTVPFSNGGNSVTSYPVGTKGLFYPEVKGITSLTNKAGLDGKGLLSSSITAGKSMISGGVATLISTGVYNQNLDITTNLKPNTIYTIYLDILENTLITNLNTLVHSYYYGGISKYIPKGKVGIYTVSFETGNIPKENRLRMYVSGQEPKGNKLIIKDLMILEGDQTNNDNLHYIEGTVNSSLNYDFVSRGKNLFDNNNIILNQQFNPYQSVYSTDDRYFTIPPISVKKGVKYTVSSTRPDCYMYIINYNLSTVVVSSHRTKYSFITQDEKIIIQFKKNDESNMTLSEAINFTIQLEEGDTATSYEPYTSTKTEFSVPRPLIRIADVEDEILDNGDLVYRNKEIVFDGSEEWILQDNTLTETIAFIIPTTEVKWNQSIHSDKFPYGLDVYDDEYEGVWIGGSDKIWIRIKRNKLASQSVTGFKNWLQFNHTTIYYQLTHPETIHNGEQGYTAPSPLPAYQNGDLVLLPKHHKKYQANSTTTITLAEEICDLDYARTEIDGKVIDLDCTLESDGKTVTIPETTGWVDIKGTIPAKNCLNPEICADMPANLGTITSANTTSIANLQQKYDKHENIQDLINLEMDYRLTILENK